VRLLSPRRALIGGTVGVLLCLSRYALAQAGPDAQKEDRVLSGGLGTALNSRGIGDEFDLGATITAADRRDAVAADRMTERIVLLPAPLRSIQWWAVWAGLRTGSYAFGAVGDNKTVAWANFEPLIGVVVEAPWNRLRLEVDVAPALAPAPSSPVTSQAALIAALSTAPHDDLLFLPNLLSGERVRVALSRRWDICRYFSFGALAEVEIGYARTETIVGVNTGQVGGGLGELDFYFRKLPRWLLVEGVILQATGDFGYTSVWTSDVVLPVRIGGQLAFAVNRNVEVTLGEAAFTPSVPLGTQWSWATSVGLRFSLSSSAPDWTLRDYNVDPQLPQRLQIQ
jgi:hypothetical protein